MLNVEELLDMTIFSVDDDSVNQKLLKSILTQYRFQKTRIFFSGEDMLTEIHNTIPDLILLDIMMPGLSGYDVLMEIKQNDRWKHIPVIMITALKVDENIEPLQKSFELGAMDYITKPFDKTEVMMRVMSALKLEKQRKDLENALSRVRTLEELLSICSYCKKIRSDEKKWEEVEVYISDHTDTLFSHSICPDCFEKYIKPQLELLKPK